MRDEASGHDRRSPGTRRASHAVGAKATSQTRTPANSGRPRFSAAAIVVLDASEPLRPRVEARIVPPFPAHDVVFAPGGARVWISSGTERRLAVYDRASRRPLFTLAAGKPPQHITFTPAAAYVTSDDAIRVQARRRPAARRPPHGSTSRKARGRTERRVADQARPVARGRRSRPRAREGSPPACSSSAAPGALTCLGGCPGELAVWLDAGDRDYRLDEHGNDSEHLRARPHVAVRQPGDPREPAKAEVRKVVVGQDHAVELFLVAALAHGHVLVEGPPGSAKTLLAARSRTCSARSSSGSSSRPDTTPTHIIGEQIMKAGEQVFIPGPIFANVVLADEINRTPPRTQAALLEAMQERHVTVDGRTHRLPDPFLVIATQNPLRARGHLLAPGVATRPLPVQDRPRLLRPAERGRHAEAAAPRHRTRHARRDQAAARSRRSRPGPHEIDSTERPEPVARYIVGIVRATREHPGVLLGASSAPRSTFSRATKAHARIQGRPSITFEDVRAIAPYVLRTA